MTNVVHVKKEALIKLLYELCAKANIHLREDVKAFLEQEREQVKSLLAKDILSVMLENANIAEASQRPLCQDTGLVVIKLVLSIGTQLNFDVRSVANVAVSEAYKDYGFRNSVVLDSIGRNSSGYYNTPCILHISQDPEQKECHILAKVLVKGFGSENKTRLFTLNPTEGTSGIVKAVVEAVESAGSDACPPYILGIGIGGTCDHAMWLSKEALFSDIRLLNPDPDIAVLEQKIQDAVNDLNIGPMGVGGGKTALAVRVLSSPTHIAGLPIAVNINCYLLRTAEGML